MKKISLSIFILCVLSFAGSASDESSRDRSGFLREWLISNPLKKFNDQSDAFALKLMAASESGALKSGAKFKSPSGEELSFSSYSAPQKILDFSAMSIAMPESCVYAASEFNVTDEFKGRIMCGSDDAIKIWLNGNPVISTEKGRAVVMDEDSVDVVFKKGLNRIFVRVINYNGGAGFCVRIVDNQNLLQQTARTLQFKSSFFNNSIAVNDGKFAWLSAPSGGKRNAAPLVRQGIMTMPGNKGNYSKYFDGSLMPKPDFLEIRTPVFEAYRKSDTADFSSVDDALAVALKVGVPEVQLSFILPKGSDLYYARKFGSDAVEKMKDSKGDNVISAKNDHRENTNIYCYSYHDKRNTESVLNAVKETVRHYADSEAGKSVFAWNFRYPGSNDWWYPISDGFFDYSDAASAAFRDFLKERYSLENIAERYSISLKNWDELMPPPAPMPGTPPSARFKDFQDFRIRTLTNAEDAICESVRKYDDKRRIVFWMTTALRTASRDGLVIDEIMKTARRNGNSLPSLTCFDYYSLVGELFGQSALNYDVPLDIEPVGSNADSFMKTYFNCMRFPVKQANWLFWVDHDPRERPWIRWVMDRGWILDELYAAKLELSSAAIMISYSDLIMNLPQKLWDKEILRDKEAFFKALEAERMNLRYFSDCSDSISMNGIKTVISADNRLIKPEMILRLCEMLEDDGLTLVIAGRCGEIDMNTFLRSWPLFSALGIKPSSVRLLENGEIRLTELPASVNIIDADAAGVKYAEWKFGKGRVIFTSSMLRELTDSSVLSAKAHELFKRAAVQGSPLAAPSGICSFIKKGEGIYYIGLINSCEDPVESDINIMLPGISSVSSAVDMTDGKTYQVKDGRLHLNFDFQWQIKVLKLELK